ncbi:MAG: hypothetical protein ACYDA4_05575 [Ignavibacteriaceae bacterium]
MLIIYLMYRGDISFVFKKTINDYYIQLKKFVNNQTPFYRFIFLSSCLLILFFISFIPINARTIFYFNDAIYRNRWLIAWASDKIPLYTGHYPQLLSTNMSLTYLFLQGEAIEFFPKAFMPLFFIGILLIFLDLALKRKSLVYLIGLLTYSSIIIAFYSLIFSGDYNTDIPVSFFGFLTFYSIFINKDSDYNNKNFIPSIIFASSAANTKLAGFYIASVLITYIMLSLYKNREKTPSREWIKFIIGIVILVFLNLFWYIIKPADMYQGLDAYFTLMSSNYLVRFINAANMLLYSFGPLISIFLLSTLIFSLFTKKAKNITILMIIPPLFLWMFFYSYDYRNLSIAIPFMAFASSFGLKYFYDKNLWLQKLIQRFNGKDLSYLNLSKRRKDILSFLFIFTLIIFFIFAGTNSFFNFGMKLSYLINEIYYMYYRTIYTIEFGYYKNVQFYVDSLRILSIVLLLFFLLRKTKIKFAHLLILSVVAIVFLNFTFLTKDNLIKRQAYDTQMVNADNIHYRVYSYLVNTGISGLIITDYSPVCRLISPEGIHFKYSTTSIDSMSFNNQKNTGTIYLLLEENKLDKRSKKFLDQQILNKKYITQFDDGDFIFLKVVS